MNTGKFKTGCLMINLVGKLSGDTAASFALLPRVLLRGSARHPDMEQITVALDELYGARIEPIVRKKGEAHCVGFYSDFPDNRFFQGSESVLEQVANLVFEILLTPIMKEGLLLAEYIDSEKKNLIDDIQAGINDKRSYSIDRLIEEMCAGEAFATNRLGDVSGVDAITPQSLTAAHRDILKCSRIEILYCGNAEPEQVRSAMRPLLDGLPERADVALPDTEVIFYPNSRPPKRFEETLDVAQGKLAVGFRLGDSMKGIPDYPAFMVFNAIYGAGDVSKLFLNVRERLSLCYYIGSMLEVYKGVLIVASGIDPSNFETALDEILTQLGQIKDGIISEQELQSAKNSVITAIMSEMDRPAGLLELYFSSILSKNLYDPPSLRDMVEAVSADRVVKIASGVEPDSVYTLKWNRGQRQ
ncbi:MAG: insulinase family protein [Oscillospiraceae bacterium]|nr:insulinase family protein [Oscillospiraceae bacterium]